ncbi:MAG: hypothetical protein P4L36_20705 [Holophaga sp.]|jgi:hypothetical protein|nr:hypothetical protein [Holophaga sp.]
MQSASAPIQEPNPAFTLLRESGLDFDQNGQKSSLQELLRLGGLFPLARIQDRLPYSRNMLSAMAKAWKGEPSEWLVNARINGQRMITLIHLDQFSEAFEAHTKAATALSDSGPIEALPDLEEGAEMLILGKGLRGVQRATAPA